MSGIVERAGCADFRALISAEQDGAATEAEKLDLAQHLARCAPCARARADFASVDATMAAACAPGPGESGPSPAVWEAIERHISAPARREAPRVRSLRSSTLRAAAIVAAIGGAFAMGHATAPRGAPPPQVISAEAMDEAAKLGPAVLDSFFVQADVNELASAALEPTPASKRNN